jgi:ADP-heptose:LPS heptosyltransferase
MISFLLNLLAQGLRPYARHHPEKNPSAPRILVIRRNRMGDMIYTLPLLHALRRHYPNAHLAVACDPAGAAIAQACAAVNEVIVLEKSWLPWLALLNNAARLQDFDWVIAAKGGFDRRLAALTRLTNGAIRIGFVQQLDRPAGYTDPVAPPENPFDEHQIETLLRLLRPLGIVAGENFPIDLSIIVPKSSLEFAAPILAQPSFQHFMLINLSSTARLKFREEDFTALAAQVLTATDLSVCFVAAPLDQPQAVKLAATMNSERVTSVATPGPLDLAAFLKKAICLFTPEGGAAHLAASVGTPAVVLWSEGPFRKWHSRAPNHVFVHAENEESFVPLERVWQALQPLLTEKI